jgi:hypothetical protein
LTSPGAPARLHVWVQLRAEAVVLQPHSTVNATVYELKTPEVQVQTPTIDSSSMASSSAPEVHCYYEQARWVASRCGEHHDIHARIAEALSTQGALSLLPQPNPCLPVVLRLLPSLPHRGCLTLITLSLIATFAAPTEAPSAALWAACCRALADPDTALLAATAFRGESALLMLDRCPSSLSLTGDLT